MSPPSCPVSLSLDFFLDPFPPLFPSSAGASRCFSKTIQDMSSPDEMARERSSTSPVPHGVRRQTFGGGPKDCCRTCRLRKVSICCLRSILPLLSFFGPLAADRAGSKPRFLQEIDHTS